MNCKSLLLFIILLSLLKLDIQAQNYIKGNVVDEITKDKIALVNISVNNNRSKGTITDINGWFEIHSDTKIEKLSFTYIGYNKKEIFISDSTEHVYVELSPDLNEYDESLTQDEHNPALRIIDSVVKHREINDIKNLKSYYFKSYENILYSYDTVDQLDLFKSKNDLLSMETVYEEFYKKPNKKRKNILANKVTSIKDKKLVYSLEDLHTTDFHDDFIILFNRSYINPTSKVGSRKYIFKLESSHLDENNDSIFIISFVPNEGAKYNAVKGRFTINSNKWAIQEIEAEPDKQEGDHVIKFEQKYELIDSAYWFRTETNTFLSSRSNLIKRFETNTSAEASAYTTDIMINPKIDRSTFNRYNISINNNKENKNDSIINSFRNDSDMDEQTSSLYYIDTLLKEYKINSERLFEIQINFSEGILPIKWFNLKLSDIVNFNVSNGLMLGLGGSTNRRFSRVFSLGGFGNYWFKAKKFNYGGNISFNILSSMLMKLDLGYSHKFEKIGSYGFNDNDFIIIPSNFKELFTKSTSLNSTLGIIYSTYLSKNMKFSMRYDVAEKVHFGFSNKDKEYKYNLSKLEFKLRIAFNEIFKLTSDGLNIEGRANPVLWLSYQKNLKNTFGSPYNFDKLQLQFNGVYENTYLGETSLMLQSGYINGVVPVTELFNIYGTGSSKVNLFTKGSFNTMEPNEFFCDRFFTVFFSHSFHRKVIDFRRYHPEIVVITNFGYGDLRKDNIQDFDIEYKDMSKGFFESGVILDNIIRRKYSKYGLGIFYRYGAYARERVWDNFFFKFSIDFKI